MPRLAALRPHIPPPAVFKVLWKTGLVHFAHGLDITAFRSVVGAGLP